MEDEKTYIVSDREGMDGPFREIRKIVDSGKSVIITVETNIEKARSTLQNRSLHKYCRTIACLMNESGTTQRTLIGKFKEGFELPVTMHMIKDIFREVGKAMHKKESTRKLTTSEIQEVYEVVDNRFNEITGVSSPWPSKNIMMEKSFEQN